MRFPGGQMTPVAIATGGKEALARYRSRFHTKSKIPPSGRNYAKHQFGDKSFTFLMEKIIGVAPETPVSVVPSRGRSWLRAMCVSVCSLNQSSLCTELLGLCSRNAQHTPSKPFRCGLIACVRSLALTHTHAHMGWQIYFSSRHTHEVLSLSLTHAHV